MREVVQSRLPMFTYSEVEQIWRKRVGSFPLTTEQFNAIADTAVQFNTADLDQVIEILKQMWSGSDSPR